jgi:hypothetical protein
MSPFHLWLALCAATCLATAAQANDDDAMHAARLRAGERIVLDGTLSHPAWQRAPAF